MKGGNSVGGRERIGEDLVNWDLTRKRTAATALEITTQALIRVAQTPTVSSTTEEVQTTTTTSSSGTTTETQTTTTVETIPNTAAIVALAQVIASLIAAVP